MNSRRVADSAACRRVKGCHRRKRCDGKARRSAETPELGCRTRGQVETFVEAPDASDAERSENKSVYYTVVVASRLSGRRFVLRLRSDRCRPASRRHDTTVHCRHSSQYQRTRRTQLVIPVLQQNKLTHGDTCAKILLVQVKTEFEISLRFSAFGPPNKCLQRGVYMMPGRPTATTFINSQRNMLTKIYAWLTARVRGLK